MQKEHIDYEWINNKVGGHGGSYSWTGRYGLAKIRYIGNRGKLYVFYCNIILFFKYLARKFKGRKK